MLDRLPGNRVALLPAGALEGVNQLLLGANECHVNEVCRAGLLVECARRQLAQDFRDALLFIVLKTGERQRWYEFLGQVNVVFEPNQ